MMLWRLVGLQDEAATKVIGDSSYNELVSRLIADSGSDAPPAPMSPAATVDELPADRTAPSSAAAAAPPAAGAGSGVAGDQGDARHQAGSAEAALAADHSAGGIAARGPPLEEAEVGTHTKAPVHEENLYMPGLPVGHRIVPMTCLVLGEC